MTEPGSRIIPVVGHWATREAPDVAPLLVVEVQPTCESVERVVHGALTQRLGDALGSATAAQLELITHPQYRETIGPLVSRTSRE